MGRLGHGADAPEIVGGGIGRVGEDQSATRAGGIGGLRQPVGRRQACRPVQRVVRSGDAHKGQLHVARAQKLAGDLIVKWINDNLLGLVTSQTTCGNTCSRRTAR